MSSTIQENAEEAAHWFERLPKRQDIDEAKRFLFKLQGKTLEQPTKQLPAAAGTQPHPRSDLPFQAQIFVQRELPVGQFQRQVIACMIAIAAVPVVLAPPPLLHAQDRVSFPTQDSGFIYADVYGKGDRAVVLAHGGRFNKESWKPQAESLAAAGFRVLALDFRGYGQSRGQGQEDPLSAPLQYDVLAAVRYLRKTNAKTVSVVGGSMGGSAAADASIEAQPGEIDRLVLLAGWASGPPEKLKGRKLFIVTRDDRSGDGQLRLSKIRAQFERAPEPKELVILEGSAHAQFIFQTAQGERLMREILRFLSAP